MTSSEIIETPVADESTLSEKLIVCLTAFSLSCASFFLAAVVLVPVLGTLMAALAVPAMVQQVVIAGALFGTPVAAAIWGIEIGAMIVLSSRD